MKALAGLHTPLLSRFSRFNQSWTLLPHLHYRLSRDVAFLSVSATWCVCSSVISVTCSNFWLGKSCVVGPANLVVQVNKSPCRCVNLSHKVICFYFKEMGESDNAQQYCLRWNNHSDSIISEFEVLLGQEDFVDVTLSCDRQSIKAHKVVLSACSTYFRRLLKVSSYIVGIGQQLI